MWYDIYILYYRYLNIWIYNGTEHTSWSNPIRDYQSVKTDTWMQCNMKRSWEIVGNQPVWQFNLCFMENKNRSWFFLSPTYPFMVKKSHLETSILIRGFKVPSRNTCLAAMDLAVSETKELAQKNGLVFDGKSIVKTMGFAQWDSHHHWESRTCDAPKRQICLLL